MTIPESCRQLKGRLIVSCQAASTDAFFEAASMARFAQAALAGGAVAIRANGPQHIAAIRRATSAPILGIQKAPAEDGALLITPSFDDARALVDSGADWIALDCTVRGQRYGAFERIARIKRELGVPVFADIATLEEGLRAAEAGADFLLSTMRGYTAETRDVSNFEPSFIADLAARSPVPVIAEGRIHRPEQAAQAIASGAYAVVVGTAITRPSEIAHQFASAIERQAARSPERPFLAIDLGGTQTKFGIVRRDGHLLYHSSAATPALGGRETLLAHLKEIAQELFDRSSRNGWRPAALGIATAGWVDVSSGTVVYATDNLPGWTGTPIADEIKRCIDIPVVVENDANAFALAEHCFGAGRGVNDFVSITLGTGVGGGCFVGGRLNRGAHFFANALGHITIEPGGIACTCGQKGCLEAYCNAAALLRYAGPAFTNVEQVIAAAHRAEEQAYRALDTFSDYLARGCATLLQLLDPKALILAGGLVQDNSLLLKLLPEHLGPRVPAWSRRKLAIVPSPLGYHGGVLGAAALAIEGC